MEPIMIEWFDDLTLGMRFKTGEKLVTREDIKRFASEFDPQPYHLDETAAERTPLKGLAASGWHTAAMAMRLIVEGRTLFWGWSGRIAVACPGAAGRCDPPRRRAG